MIGILNDFLTKIKPWLDVFKDKREQILLSTVIIFVALSSFALGRYSVGDQSDVRANTTSSQTGNYQTKNVQTNAVNSSNGSFVASKNGTKYYLSTCSGSSKISDKNKIYFKSKTEAEAAGYSKASNCNF